MIRNAKTYAWCQRTLSSSQQQFHLCVCDHQWKVRLVWDHLRAIQKHVQDLDGRAEGLSSSRQTWTLSPPRRSFGIIQQEGYTVPTCCMETNSASIATNIPKVGSSSESRGSCLIAEGSRLFLRLQMSPGVYTLVKTTHSQEMLDVRLEYRRVHGKR